MLRLLVLVLALMILVAVPFAIWGERIETWLSIDGATEWMRGFGGWAWAAGVGLIALDIFLPIPASAIMAALGIIYGPVLGGMLSALGSVVAGLTGYGLCRLIGPNVADRLAGAQGMAQARRLFAAWGGWLVVASRWLPVLPETVSFLAGLARMRFWRFFAALTCGSLPLGFAYAGIGSLGADAPGPTLVVAAVAPLLLWMLVRPVLVAVSRRG
jgi:uncharacterized membrane protein YdjX (TVP38/TMEM64 family)